eukprot:7639232-Alexandrium_andersonii.AAC.1
MSFPAVLAFRLLLLGGILPLRGLPTVPLQRPQPLLERVRYELSDGPVFRTDGRLPGLGARVAAW